MTRPLIPPARLLRIQKFVETTGMPDRCIFLLWSDGSQSEIGEVVNIYTEDTKPDGTPNILNCRMHMIPSSAQHETEDAEIITADATLHVPLNTPINNKNMVKILSRWGNTFTPQIYTIIGGFMPNATDITLHIKLATNTLD